MARRHRRQHSFAIGMAMYAIVFFLVLAGGLLYFWKYLEAYEASRPNHAAEKFLSSLTAEEILDNAGLSLDETLQSREQQTAFVESELMQSLSFSRRVTGEDEASRTYVLKTDDTVLGTFRLRQGTKDSFGFSSWELDSEEYDLSAYLGEAVSVTVPSNYTVYVGENALDESYISQSDIPYSALGDFYDDYTLPTKVTYTAEGYLGELTFTVCDTDGEEVDPTADPEWDAVLDNCTQSEKDAIAERMKGFVNRYVAFAGSHGGSESGNFSYLNTYLVPNGELANRLRTALDGLQWGQTVSNRVDDVNFNRYYRIDDTHYLCDLTYQYTVTGHEEATALTENLQVVIVNMDGTLYVEALDNY